MTDRTLSYVLRNIKLQDCDYLRDGIFYTRRIVAEHKYDCETGLDNPSYSECEFLVLTEHKIKKAIIYAYYSLLDEAIENEIKIIAITDHNTFDGVNKIKNLIRANKKYRDLLIVCGIEITCFSKHMIAIFPDSFSIEQQNVFLNEIGISESLRGTEDAIADNYGPAILLDKVGKYGGFGILAHADAEKGFLQGLCSNAKKQKNSLTAESPSLKLLRIPFCSESNVITNIINLFSKENFKTTITPGMTEIWRL